ncbi:MAG: DnaJ domain-containing protein [Proteobacteria bacterium]|nr:DnaJ domain-containing protein [Pseudomonadota bacterium]
MDTQADPIARKDSPVEIAPRLDLSAARLSAQEGFVLSRIAGETTIRLLCDATGLGDAATVAVLRTLYDKGLVIVDGQRARPVARPQPAAKAAVSPEAVSAAVAVKERVELDPRDLAEVDAEESRGIELKRELRLRLRSVRRRLKAMSFFELLGLAPEADLKALRRAYFERSKEFHPDRYYTKNLGPYKEMLAEIFRQTKAAYEYLQDDDKRAAYRVLVLAQHEEEQLEQQVRRQSAEALEAVPTAPAAAQFGAALGAEGSAEQAASPRAEPLPVASLPPRERRATAGQALFRRQLRERLGTAPIPVAARSPTASSGAGATGGPGSAAGEPVPPDSAERALRRDRDQLRQQRHRQQRVAGTLGGAKNKAQEYFEQGLKQLEEGKLLAAAASLKLAASFDPENLDYLRRSEAVGREARASTADGYFKRALLEEQVGRTETAALYFQRAADASGAALHLQRAAEGFLWLDDLKNAREYATKALQAEPNSVDARIVLARVLLAGGLKQHARREVDLALKIEPGHPAAKELLKRVKKA